MSASNVHTDPSEILVINAPRKPPQDLDLFARLGDFRSLERLYIDCSVAHRSARLSALIGSVENLWFGAGRRSTSVADDHRPPIRFVCARVELSQRLLEPAAGSRILFRKSHAFAHQHATGSRCFKVYEADLGRTDNAVMTWASNGRTAIPAEDFNFLQAAAEAEAQRSQSDPHNVSPHLGHLQLHLASRYTHRFSLRSQPECVHRQLTHLRLEHPYVVSLDMNAAERDFAIIQDIVSLCPNLVHCSFKAYNLAATLVAALDILPSKLATLVFEDCHLGSWVGGLRCLTDKLSNTRSFLPHLRALWIQVEDPSVLSSRLQHTSTPDRDRTPEPATLEALHAACRSRHIDPFNPVPWKWYSDALTDGTLVPARSSVASEI